MSPGNGLSPRGTGRRATANAARSEAEAVPRCAGRQPAPVMRAHIPHVPQTQVLMVERRPARTWTCWPGAMQHRATASRLRRWRPGLTSESSNSARHYACSRHSTWRSSQRSSMRVLRAALSLATLRRSSSDRKPQKPALPPALCTICACSAGGSTLHQPRAWHRHSRRHPVQPWSTCPGRSRRKLLPTATGNRQRRWRLRRRN